MNLLPGDVLLSYKDPGKDLWPPSEILNRIGHHLLLHYGNKLYPGGDNRYDHVRLVCGPIYGDAPKLVLGFEFTYPAARFFWFPEDPDHWMFGASYSKLFRPKDEALTDSFRELSIPMRARRMHQRCLPWDGTLYDVGQLLDINFGFHRFFDLGSRRKPCSVGARIVQESGGVLLSNLFPEVKVEKTPPCSWANSKLFGAPI